MKSIFYVFLYLNIYTSFFCELSAQKLELKFDAEKDHYKTIIDSIHPINFFDNYQQLKVQVDSIQTKIQKLGFIDCNIKELKKINDSLFIANYFFGNKYQYLKIYYNKNDFRKKELENISHQVTNSFFILHFNLIESKLQQLVQYKSSNGNTFVKIALSEIKKEDSNTISASIFVKNGIRRTIDSIVVRGYEKFSASHLKYYAGIKTGNLFNQNQLNKQNQTLNQLGFVSSTKSPEILFNKEKTTVFLYLKKKNNNLFDGIIGFANNENSKKLIFNGYLNLELNNNLNFGEQLTIRYKADGNDQQRFKAAVKLPYILKTPLGINAELSIFKKDTTFINNQQEINLSYQINPLVQSFIGYKTAKSTNLLDQANTNKLIEDLSSKFFNIGLTFVKTQNKKMFYRKSFLEIETNIGERSITNSKKENQFIISILLQHIFNLNNRNSIYLQNQSNLLNSNSYLLNELFRFGGINNIRGFNENSLDASLYSILSTEYRYLFNSNMYLHSIIDAGYFENKVFNIKQKLYSFGIGLGMQTKAGLFKFNIANGTNENQSFTFSNTKVHLSLSSSF